LILQVPADQLENLDETLTDIFQVARSHGIGVIVAGSPEDYDTWDEKVPPERHQPDPIRLDDFIRNQMSADTQARIRKAF
jgi:hypothetical protein